MLINLLKLLERVLISRPTPRHRTFTDGGNGYVVPRQPSAPAKDDPSEECSNNPYVSGMLDNMAHQTHAPTLDTKVDTLHELVAGLDPTWRGGLDTVQALRMVRETADAALKDAVRQAVREGATWDQVGKQLGVTRQAAWERYS